MKLVVTDTNVFIDLMNVDALAAFFALGFEVHTTDFVINELDGDQQAQLLPFRGNGQLGVARFTDAEVKVFEVMATSVTIQFTDRSVIFLATRLNGMILSGDGNLWKECKARKLDVHGSIWVIEQIWSKRLIPPVSCIERLEHLKKTNSRLPKDKIDALIERIRKS
jgi:predicted nucleic acid-binding protein